VKGHVFAADTVWQQEFEESFPYEETDDQIRAIRDQDRYGIGKGDGRLLCGDVGFGKTEVASGEFKCVMDGRQRSCWRRRLSWPCSTMTTSSGA
jgi:transcription-repair coupling factor (superfamily II helicase)